MSPKSHRKTTSGLSFALSAAVASVFFVCVAPSAQADTFTFSSTAGTSGSPSGWATGANWSGGTAPTSSSDNVLSFTAPVGFNMFATNNIAAGFQLNRLTLTNNSSNTNVKDVSVAGSSLNFVKNGSDALPTLVLTRTNALSSSGADTILSAGITVTDALTITGSLNSGNSAQISGAIANNAGMTFDGSGTVGIVLGTGVISGAGGITINGSYNVSMSGNNTYDGLTDVQSGKLTLNRSGGTIKNTSAVQVSGGELAVTQSDTVGAVTLSSGTISGAGTLTGSSYSLTNTGSVSAILGGSGVALTKTGAGTATLNATNGYTGATNINAGKLIVDGNISTSILTTVNDNGTLGGIGIVGALTAMSGGTVAPGNGAGILFAGITDLQSDSILALDLGGTSAGVNYDRLNVTGSATLAGMLSLTVTGTYADNALLFLLVNDEDDAIIGTFSNYAEGANFTLGGQTWTLTYLANNTALNTGTFTGGNDVALMAIPEPNFPALLGGLGVLAMLRRRRA